MTPYVSSYILRYSIPSVQQQTEVAVIHDVQDIQNEDPATADHANRLAWANWANKNSDHASIAFAWPVAMNPTIQAAVQADPSGQSVQDSDVQFVVTSALPAVIADFIANPPPSVTVP